MKRKHAKALRMLATRLPVSYELRIHSIYQKYSEMDERVNKDGLSNEIDEDKRYKVSGKIYSRVNHYKRLKESWIRGQEQEVINYIKWVDANNRKVKEHMTKLELVDEGLMSIVSKGAKGFWKNLAIWLYAFLSIFNNKNED